MSTEVPHTLRRLEYPGRRKLERDTTIMTLEEELRSDIHEAARTALIDVATRVEPPVCVETKVPGHHKMSVCYGHGDYRDVWVLDE